MILSVHALNENMFQNGKVISNTVVQSNVQELPHVLQGFYRVTRKPPCI